MPQQQLNIPTDMNLCKEITSAMLTLEFDNVLIDYIKNNDKYSTVYDSPPVVQRVSLITLYYRLLLSSSVQAPDYVRIALNSSGDVLGWLTDMKLVILPWMKENRRFIVL